MSEGGDLEAMSDSKVQEEAMTTEERILRAFGEVTGLFMSNPQPGTEQVMPTQELGVIAGILAAEIKEHQPGDES